MKLSQAEKIQAAADAIGMEIEGSASDWTRLFWVRGEEDHLREVKRDIENGDYRELKAENVQVSAIIDDHFLVLVK